jgi:uncharacterized protein HemY
MNMNVSATMTVMDAIVALALLFAVVFVVAWAVSPRLRVWIENPNYKFRRNARRYDEALMRERTRL